MKHLGRDLHLDIAHDDASGKLLSKWYGLLGRYILSGRVRGKSLTIFTTKFPGMINFPLRIVVKMPIKYSHQLNITIKARSILGNLQKIFDKNFIQSNNSSLDRRLQFSADVPDVFHYIVSYDEICEQMKAVWTTQSAPGIMIIGSNTIVYHEPYRILTNNARERIKNAAHLLCDISDAITHYDLRSSIQVPTSDKGFR